MNAFKRYYMWVLGRKVGFMDGRVDGQDGCDSGAGGCGWVRVGAGGAGGASPNVAGMGGGGGNGPYQYQKDQDNPQVYRIKYVADTNRWEYVYGITLQKFYETVQELATANSRAYRAEADRTRLTAGVAELEERLRYSESNGKKLEFQLESEKRNNIRPTTVRTSCVFCSQILCSSDNPMKQELAELHAWACEKDPITVEYRKSQARVKELESVLNSLMQLYRKVK